MILTTERIRAFRFDLSLFEKTAEQLAADKIIADKAIADAELERLKDANHAAAVIKRTNDEARANRERAEAAEAKATAAQKIIDDAAAQKLIDDKKFEEAYNTEKNGRAADAEKHKADLAVRDGALLRTAVLIAAKEKGILDADFIDLPVFSEALKLAKVDGGKVIGADDVVSKMLEVKASAFKTAETAEEKTAREAKEKAEKDEKDRIAQQNRDREGRFTDRPVIKDEKGQPVDWEKLTPEQFAQRDAELRAKIRGK